MFVPRVDDGVDGLFDADVVHLVAIVGEDDVDEVFSDVVDVAADGGEQDGAFLAAFDAVHVGFEEGDGGFHGFGGLEDERELHLSGAEEVADGFHAVEEQLVDDVERFVSREGVGEVAFEAIAVAVDDALLEAVLDGEFREVFLGRADLLVFGEEGDVVREWVEAFAAAVVDEVEGGVPAFVADLGARQDLAGVDNGGGEASAGGFVEEDGVEDGAGGGDEAEADVGDTEDRIALGHVLHDGFDAVERFEAEAAVGVVAGGDREGEAVEEDVLGLEAVLVDAEVVDALGDGQLAIGGLGHRFFGVFVDGEGDDGCSVSFEHGADGVDFVFAVFEVDRVDDGFAAGEFEACFEDVDFGAVEHEWNGDVLGVAGDDAFHVRDAVATDVVDADIENVGTLGDLVSAYLDDAVDVVFEEESLEHARAVGVAAFADDEEGIVLAHGDGLVDAADAWFAVGIALFGRAVADGVCEHFEVVGCCSAASADGADAVFLDELDKPAGEFVWGERVLGLAVDELGQTGVGLHNDGSIAEAGQEADVLAHFLWACGAVETDGGDFVVLGKGDDGGGGFRADEHGAGGFDGEGAEDGQFDAFFVHCVDAGDDGGLGLEDVLAGFDEEGVDFAVDEATRLLGVAVDEGVPGGLSEGWQFGAGTHRAEDEARFVRSGVFVAGGASDVAGHLVEHVGLFGDAEFGEYDFVGAEGVGEDAV